MTMKILTAIAVATSILVMSNAAEAGGNKRHGFNDGGHYKTTQNNRRHKHGRFKRHLFFDHDNSGHSSRRACRRLKRKAYYTGSRYWWKNYQRCVNRYHY